MKRLSTMPILVIAVFAVLLAAGFSALGSEHRLAAVGRSRLASGAQLSLQLGEVPFAVPIRLRTLGHSSVREKPGRGYPVLFILDAGTPLAGHAYLTGHSYAEDWVRVSDESGRSGWVLRALVMPRHMGER